MFRPRRAVGGYRQARVSPTYRTVVQTKDQSGLPRPDRGRAILAAHLPSLA
jgi:hypothetical protein